jgi:hypothetical protein
MLPGLTWKRAVQKTVVDQVCFAPFIISANFTSVAVSYFYVLMCFPLTSIHVIIRLNSFDFIVVVARTILGICSGKDKE